MAQIAVLLDAEAASLAPGKRLVYQRQRVSRQMFPPIVPMFTQQRRGNGRGRLREHRIAPAQKCDCSIEVSDASAPISTPRSVCRMSLEPGDIPYIQNIFRLEKLLPHGRNQVRAPATTRVAAGDSPACFASKESASSTYAAEAI
jgi:hypothetical protein